MLYSIILVGSLFTTASVPTGLQFITPEACKLVASKMTEGSKMNYQCVPTSSIQTKRT